MIKLACLGRGYKEQIEARPEALDGVELIWHGTSLAQLLGRGDLRPKVLLVELDSLGSSPGEALKGLGAKLGPELVLLDYRFARRRDITELTDLGDFEIRALQGPVTLATLRSQMLGLIVRDLLGADGGGAEKEICSECGRPL